MFLWPLHFFLSLRVLFNPPSLTRSFSFLPPSSLLPHLKHPLPLFLSSSLPLPRSLDSRRILLPPPSAQQLHSHQVPCTSLPIHKPYYITHTLLHLLCPFPSPSCNLGTRNNTSSVFSLYLSCFLHIPLFPHPSFTLHCVSVCVCPRGLFFEEEIADGLMGERKKIIPKLYFSGKDIRQYIKKKKKGTETQLVIAFPYKPLQGWKRESHA